MSIKVEPMTDVSDEAAPSEPEVQETTTPKKRKRNTAYKKKKNKETERTTKAKSKTTKTRPSKPNKWIQHYMKWRSEHPEIVKQERDIKKLVVMAKETYTPVKRGFTCKGCGKENFAPLKKLATD